jgi:hypothetical protein
VQLNRFPAARLHTYPGSTKVNYVKMMSHRSSPRSVAFDGSGDSRRFIHANHTMHFNQIGQIAARCTVRTTQRP